MASDMEFDPDSMGYPDWSGNDEQVIYIVGGCTLTGLDTEGSEVRYISGARNADGDLIVTDAEGNVCGAGSLRTMRARSWRLNNLLVN